ncbi:MAG TPA: helix-turn-helix domain-containing protein [Nitrososphaerales archaeon]|nr:helix-turn-helix domain-containing protein [Nitrososphaerales archaeon]
MTSTRSEVDLREAFGLNSYESRVYLALLSGPKKPKEAAASSGVPLPRTYDTLRSLCQKGFANDALGAFAAVRPSVALKSRVEALARDFGESQSRREAASKRLVEALEPLYSKKQESEPVMLRGVEAIAAAFAEVLGGSGHVYLMVRKGLEAKGLFLRYLSEASAGRRVDILVPVGAALSASDMKALDSIGASVRRSSAAVLDVMTGDESVIFGVPARGSDESFGAVAVWVKDASFAVSMTHSLGQVWRAARPVRS